MSFLIRIGSFSTLCDEAIGALFDDGQWNISQLEHRIMPGADVEFRPERLFGLGARTLEGKLPHIVG